MDPEVLFLLFISIFTSILFQINFFWFNLSLIDLALSLCRYLMRSQT